MKNTFYPIFLQLEGKISIFKFPDVCKIINYPSSEIFKYNISEYNYYFRVNTIFNGRELHQLLELLLGERVNIKYFDRIKVKEYIVQENYGV